MTGVLKEAADIMLACNVGGQRKRIASSGDYLAGDCTDLFGVACGDNNLRTMASECHCGGASNSSAAARHQRGASGQVTLHGLARGRDFAF
jgi:hypothetical protein